MSAVRETDEFMLDEAELERILNERGRTRGDLISLLQAVQKKYNYLPKQVLRYVCAHSEITPADVIGVSTFYTQFRHSPAGRHTVSVCVGTACHVKGASRITDALRRHLKLAGGSDTDGDNCFTLREVGCLGCCSLAPAVQIDDVIYGHVTTDGVGDMLRDFLSRPRSVNGATGDGGAAGLSDDCILGDVRVGLGSCCIASGAADVEAALHETVRQRRLPVRVRRVGCVGLSYSEPLIEVVKPGQPPRLFGNVKPEDVPSILRAQFPPAGWRDRLKSGLRQWLEHVYTDESWGGIHRYTLDVREPRVASFLDPQTNIATEEYGRMDPVSLPDYRAARGFEGLYRALRDMTRSQVLDLIAESGLRGRGGGGFATGRKWNDVANAPGDVKYVVGNGDEGDPGAFMDRMLLESYPFRVIEGMTTAAYAVGAGQGVMYIRAEYPLALQRVRAAIAACRQAGLLGADIMNTGFAFDLRVMEGAGAFVCGEETALVASLEGKRGMPRMRPPYPSQKGFHGCPTLVNNTETFSLVPWILRHGAAAFAAVGTRESRGTKVFALAGKVERGGLIEVPMGITIRQVVNDIGGGVPDGRRLKAVQIGGPSGGCIPEWLADTPIDYEALVDAGAMMGSGGLVVLDDSDCMVEIARYFLAFTQHESCGKCTFCRIGVKRMLEILERFCEGCGKMSDLEALERLAAAVQRGSLCGLGTTAPNPVLTTLRYFRDEYEAHIHGVCPARQCKGLIRFTITDDCIGCTKCAQNCPADAIRMTPYEKHAVDLDKCVRCGACLQACPSNAVEILSGPAETQDREQRPYADS